tara:strand:+ start:135 stop:1565 length:1431 start_codon:yes stop_codon:yes gene_type:complete
MDHHVKQTPVQGVTGLWGGTQGALTSGGEEAGLVGENYSVQFDGSNDWLEVADDNGYSFGSGDFTTEFWVNPEGTISNKGYVCKWNTNGNLEWFIGTNSSTLVFAYSINGNSYTIPTSGYTMQSGSWQHIAVTRSGNDVKIFVDGDQEGSTHDDSGATYHDGTDPLQIGSNEHGGSSWRMDGYISNVRIIKGQALYTSDFTPTSTPFGNTTQGANADDVKLLCCNKSSVTGSVVTSSTISVGGGSPSSALGPFGDYSVDFDGNDFLSIAANSAFHIGTSDYTVELWMYKESNGELVSAFEQASPWTGWLMGTNFGGNNGHLAFYIHDGGSSYVTMHSTNTVASNQWQHLAVTRSYSSGGSGSTWRFFLGGTLDSTHTSTINPGDSGENIMIGADKNYPSLLRGFDGRISNVRITKGQCLYTSSFTVPSSPLTTTSQSATASNVKLICCNNSSVTGSSKTPTTITSVGDPTMLDGPF